MDLKKKSFSMDFMGRPLTLEVSKLAEQANAAVIGKYGDTVVLATAVMDSEDRDVDYLPLMVDYEQKFYSVGKILGGRFMKREGKSSDDAVLRGRIVDRTIRPLFDYRLRRDLQVVITVLSYDKENDHTFIGLVAASTALAISDIPWSGPVAGVNVAMYDGIPVINPNRQDARIPQYESFISGTEDFINMIELEGREASDEGIMLGFEVAHKEIGRLIDFQKKIVKEIGKPKAVVKLSEPKPEIGEKIKSFLAGKLEPAIYVADKVQRQNNLLKIKNELKEYLKGEGVEGLEMLAAETFLETEIDSVVHKNILEKNKRPDGRGLEDVRDLHAEIAMFPRLHGSSLFVRGNTQALGVVTLDSPDAGQLMETIDFSGTKHFLLHYNFPNYSVGEIGSFRGPGRREIGHGALAEKALKNMIPPREDFPYTIRVVSEILSSNGSSSMATVCAASLALMDAGVPIKAAVGGIAMGLMSDESGNYKILTDLQGPEDQYGDMDFKVAGTSAGVTAIQLDVKIRGLNMKMVRETIAQSGRARSQVLEVMNKTIAGPRKDVSKYAPIILKTRVNPEQIGLVVGPGGKTINAIIADTGVADISIEQDGMIFVTAPNRESADRAIAAVDQLTKQYVVGDIVEGKVVRILEFGAIVDLGGGQDGMVHVSELKEGFVKRVEDVLKLGDMVRAKVVRSEDGRIGLSIKALTKE